MKKIYLILLSVFLLATAGKAQTPDFSEFKQCEFLTMAFEYAIIVHYKYDIPPEITVAVAILESGYGRSYAARVRCNYFGMVGGKKNYKSVYESFNDFGFLLRSKKRYKRLFTLDGTDFVAWGNGLHECGYNWREEYPVKLIQLIKQYKLNEL